jgi:hypothetical protein
LLFQDKPLSVLYIEECLINPPVFPGTKDISSYLNELHFAALAGYATKAQLSEQVGGVLGSLASKFVIAACIVSVRTEFGKKREIRKLNSAMKTLEGKLGGYSNKSWSLDQYPWGGNIDLERVAIGMAKNQQFLSMSTEPDVVLEYELNVGTHFVAFRYQVMRNFTPSYLREKLWEGIKQVTRVSLDSEGQPIR